MKGPKMSWRICAGAVLCLLVLPSVTLAAGKEGQEDVARVGQNHPLYEIVAAMGFDDARIVAVLQDPEIDFEEALNRIIEDSEAAENGPEVVEIVEPQPIVVNNEVKLEEEEEEREELNVGVAEERQEDAVIENNVFNELLHLGFEANDIRRVLARPGVNFDQALGRLLGDEPVEDEGEEENLAPELERGLDIIEPPPIVRNDEAKLEEEERDDINIGGEEQAHAGERQGDAVIENNVFNELLHLGFEANDIRRVLARPGVNFDQALGRLLGDEPVEDEGEEEDLAPELERGLDIIEPPPIVRNDEAKIEEEEREDITIGGEEQGEEGVTSHGDMLHALLNMGFPEERCRKVLSEPRITFEKACDRLLNDDPVEEVDNWMRGPLPDDIENWFQEEAEKDNRPIPIRDQQERKEVVDIIENGEENVNVEREEKTEEELDEEKKTKDRPILLVEEPAGVEPEDQVNGVSQGRTDSNDEVSPDFVEAGSRVEASAEELPAEPFAKEEDLPDDPFAKLVEMGFSEDSVRQILAVPGVWFETALITLLAHQQNAQAQNEETPGGEDEEEIFVSELAASGLDDAMIDKLGSKLLAHMDAEDDVSDDTVAVKEGENAAEKTAKPVGVSPEDLPDDPVAKLVAMGFSESAVRKVLAEPNIWFEMALNTLLGQETTEDGVQAGVEVKEGDSNPAPGLESSYYGYPSKVDLDESNTNTDAGANVLPMSQSRIDLTPLEKPEDAKEDDLLFNSQISFIAPVEKATVGDDASYKTPLFPETTKLLLDMGFDPDQVQTAVRDAEGNVDRAMEILTEPQVAELKTKAEESHSTPTSNSNDDHKAPDLPFEPQYYRFGGVLSPLPRDFSMNPENYRAPMEQLYREFHRMAHFRESEPAPQPLWSHGQMPLSSLTTRPQAVEAYVALQACNDLIRRSVVEPNRVSVDAIGGLNYQADGVVMGGVLLPLYKGPQEETLRAAIEKGPERNLDIVFAGSQEESMNRGFLGYQTLYQIMEKGKWFLQRTGGQSPIGIVLTTVRGSVAIIVETSMFGDEVYRVYDPNPDEVTGKRPPVMFRSYSQQDIAFTLRDKFPFVDSGSLAEDLVQNSYEAAFVRYQQAPKPELNLGELDTLLSAFQKLDKPSANSKSSQAEQ